ncbi:serine/threonine protein phosphatase [Bacillus glycinifermentans]|uniref:metallophosphoesterase family protein n=1 Tax=Bacillus glycinifermentans TaxID=1664069 RepID=UPI001583BC8C|nr:metallophosphoesterase family protein [Bacillus glycinifermentans]NUJ16783.1 serine/threonine protein phosphatase [Bacillus glycinifermentans]
MKYNKTFVISDIHGEYEKFEELMKHWNPETMNLAILGDMIDRGENSLKVVQKVMQLKKEYQDQVVVLKGNHEDMLLLFLEVQDYETGDWYFNNGGNRTCASFVEDEYIFFKSYEERARQVLQRKDEIKFIRELPMYYEFGDVLFVHAGINPILNDWKEIPRNDFLWSRGCWNFKNQTGKIVVFGHTITQFLHPDKRNDIWISECGTYVDIDGGAVFGGQLNAIIINDKGEILEKYKVL